VQLACGVPFHSTTHTEHPSFDVRARQGFCGQNASREGSYKHAKAETHGSYLRRVGWAESRSHAILQSGRTFRRDRTPLSLTSV